MMESLGINGSTAILLTLFVTGFVELVKYLVNREWEQAAIIVIAGVAGLVGGIALGVGWIAGVCGGFAASGLITVAKRFGEY